MTIRQKVNINYIASTSLFTHDIVIIQPCQTETKSLVQGWETLLHLQANFKD